MSDLLVARSDSQLPRVIAAGHAARIFGMLRIRLAIAVRPGHQESLLLAVTPLEQTPAIPSTLS